MKDLFLRKQILIEINENSGDLKKLQEIIGCVDKIRCFSRNYNVNKFEVNDGETEEGIALVVTFDSKEALKHAERLMNLAEEMEKETKAFYKTLGFKVTSPVGEMTGLMY